MIDRQTREYRFGDFVFVPHRQLLLRKGVPVVAGSRALAMLELLVSRAGEVVSKEALRSHVWPNTYLHESNLKVTISALRRLLPHATADLPYIVTVPGRGYRFVAPVQVAVEQAVAPAEQLPGSPIASTPLAGLPITSAIVGRDEEIAGLEARLAAEGWVTIVGPAGVGKTTVAVGVAERLEERLGDGACFVDLASLTDPQLVGAAVATALGVHSDAADLLAQIVDILRGRSMVLVLDNCEHVRNAVATLAEHLRTVMPCVLIFATSREPMGSKSESVFRLGPLQTPYAGRELTAREAMTYPAVELFVTLAEQAWDYVFSDDDAPVVAAICRRLDGIALAIVLAAGRLSTSSPVVLLGLLNESFDALSLEASNGNPRHQTLLATLDWSYRLLSRDEAQLLRLLSVFTGAFSMEDIIGVADDRHVRVAEIAAGTESLVAKSLVSVTYLDGALRYRLLDATRSFAAAQLATSGEHRSAQQRLADYLLVVFERAEAEWAWRARSEWTAAYGRRANDLRKAIEWAFGDDGDAPLGVRLTAAAIPLWDELSTIAESVERAGRALRAIDGTEPGDPEVKMKLMASYASGLNFSEHLGREVDAAWQEGYLLALGLGSTDYQLRTLWGHAVLQSFSGRHGHALATLERFRVLAERENDVTAMPDGTRLTLMTRFYLGEVEEAATGLTALARSQVPALEQARVARFQVDRLVGIRVGLALAVWMRGDHRQAQGIMQSALDRAAELDHRVSQSNALAQIGVPLALLLGNIEQARRNGALLARNLSLHETAIWSPVSRFLDGAIAAAEGDPQSVDTMRAAIDALIRNNFVIRVPMYLAMLAEAALAHDRLDEARSSIAAAHERSDIQAERWCLPEILRVKGLVHRHEGDMEGARQTLWQAVEAAAAIGALTFELRAAMDLAELLDDAGERTEAARLLSMIHARFDPSLCSRDVVRSGEILERLRGG
ncbi:ATP-binding protein [Novosphingobium kaempferiae]|uniref:ATP-binding protein n=1 Tax=Novosphingobium kaempferiae TaxID=2896849 RepID=UPI001E4CD44D|nr:winged helix-turn-helix domain-containing protein [Novosphingobium kaempferiae]